MFTQFALLDETVFGPEEIFDGIFQGDDMSRPGLVDDVDEGGNGGGFARTRGPAEEDQTRFGGTQFFQGGMEIETFQGRYLSRKEPGGNGQPPAGGKDIETQPGVGFGDGEVDGEAVLQDLQMSGGEKFHDQGVDLFRGKDDLGDKDDLAVLAEDDRVTAGDVHVGHAFGKTALDEGGECFHDWSGGLQIYLG